MEQNNARKTGLQRRMIEVIVLSALVVLLAGALAIAANLVGIYTLSDRYLDDSGVEQTATYQVRRGSDGLYALYNSAGKLMEKAPDNGFNNYSSSTGNYVVYETEVGGNQYRINTTTGEYALYATVDTEGEEQLGGTVQYTRVMMFPRIAESQVYSLEVQNANGKYRFARAANGTVGLWLWEDGEWAECLPGVYSQQAYVSLCVNCGYTITLQKLDFTNPLTPVDEEGNIRYADYGLAGEDVASYTITTFVTDKETNKMVPDKEYTVLVGDLTVNGTGYYVKRADWDAVYVMDTGIAPVLATVEAVVEPQIIYPLGETTYPMVGNFELWKVGQTSPEVQTELVTSFSYVDLTLRDYTLYQITPYVIPETISLLKGYEINDWEISTLLMRLYEMQLTTCKKLMPALSDLKAYGLTENCYALSFEYNTGANQDGNGPYVRNNLLISQKTYDAELGQEVYYVYSYLPEDEEGDSVINYGFEMIVAVEPYYLSFVEWEMSRWYNPNYFSTDLSFVKELHLKLGEEEYDFYLDNSKTDLSQTISTEKLEVISPQYDSADHKIDYEVHTTETTDTGGQKALDYTGVQNFKRFCSKLFQGVIEGDVNNAQFRAETGMTVEEFIAADTADDQCIAKLRYHLEDYAKDHNKVTINGIKLWGENNRRDIVLRFYRYESSGRKYLMTVEVLERDSNGQLVTDKNGEPITDATRGVGLFYVNAASLNVLAGYAHDLFNQVLIPQ